MTRWRGRRELQPEDEPLGGVGCLFVLVLLAFGLALLDAAMLPGAFAP